MQFANFWPKPDPNPTQPNHAPHFANCADSQMWATVMP